MGSRAVWLPELFTLIDYFTIIDKKFQKKIQFLQLPSSKFLPPHYNSPPPLTLVSPSSLFSSIFGCCREAQSILEVMLEMSARLDCLFQT